MDTHPKEIKTGWNLDNSFIKLPSKFYTKLEPTPVSSPEMIIVNDSLAEMLGLVILWYLKYLYYIIVK